ncbi:MAG TPA: group 1 truncated hemoglobin [Burkholderiaceae bacterium]|nr:group 1 truncated hemoglobin [Burkholderiaceae bacterium]
MKHSRPARIACSALLSICVIGACTTPAAQRPPALSLYERLGGRPAIVALVDDAIRNFAADPRINQRFAKANPDHLQNNLVDLLCERAGGPCVYKGRNMADAHDGMQIRDDEFNALLEDIAKSMDKLKVPAAERRESLAILNQMRNAIVGH